MEEQRSKENRALRTGTVIRQHGKIDEGENKNFSIVNDTAYN